jgi:hypothetical protein
MFCIFFLYFFFTGNDFLPHLPALDIRTGGLGTVYLLYCCKSPNTDAEDALPCPAPYLQAPAAARFTCFTGAKV